jgi:membrane protease YdiL (CAAX protease family)
MMKKIWKAIGLILALMAIYYAAQTIITFIIGMIRIIEIMPAIMQASSGDYQDIVRKITEESMRAVSAQTPLILFFSVAITIPLYYLIYRSRKQELLTFLSVRSIGAVSIPILIIFGISLNFLVEWLLALVSQLELLAPLFERYNELAQFITGGSFILSILAVGLIGPVFEEILFRGLIFGELRKITKVRAALLVQAVLFGVYHLNIIQGSYAFIIGILLGYVYYRSNSIIAPVIVHITINTTSVILSRVVTGGEPDKWTVVIVAASAILFMVTSAFVLISRSFRRPMDNSLYDRNHVPKLEPPSAGNS